MTKWQPIQLLEWNPETFMRAARAGSFFSTLGFFCSQLSMYFAWISVAARMDLASLVLRWIKVTRGLLTMAAIDVVRQHPSNVHHSAECFRLFLSPFAGINRVDFRIVRPLRIYTKGFPSRSIGTQQV